MRNKTKTNRTLYERCFPRFEKATGNSWNSDWFIPLFASVLTPYSVCTLSDVKITQSWVSNGYLTIIPRARMGSESIAHEAEGRMGYMTQRS